MSRPVAPPRWKILPLLAAAALVGCADEVASQEPVARAPAVAASAGGAAGQAGGGASAPERVLARIDGEPITLADLEDVVGDDLATLEFQYGNQRYQLLRRGVQTVLRKRLLAGEAARRGITPDELVRGEIEGKLEISDEQVQAWYEANRARLQGRSLEMLAPAIRQFLQEQELDRLLTEFTDRIAAERKVEMLLEPFRAAIAVEGHPSLGPEGAPVTLVEFSDFECPFCGSFFATIERIKSEYGDRVRLVYRQFPLAELHPHAQKAAEASLCAAEQGRFWQLHDLMFREQQRLAVEDLKDKAERVGLDTAAFAECLDSGRMAARVQADLQAGRRLGVTGTPALFVNGRPVEGGAVAFETIARVIDEELARAGS